jgi:hypothetical protein
VQSQQITHHLQTTLGSPRANCAMFGICEVTPLQADEWAYFQPSAPREAGAIAWANAEGHIWLSFPWDKMSAFARQRFFSGQYFRVDAPKRFPYQLADALGQPGFTVQVGLYPMVQDQSGAVLELMPQYNQRKTASHLQTFQVWQTCKV